MPWDKRDRFVSEYGLSLEESQQITEQREVADYYEEIVKAGAPAAKAANWMRTERPSYCHRAAWDATSMPEPSSPTCRTTSTPQLPWVPHST